MGHDHDHGDPHLQHHYNDMEQQVRAGKLGMWLFLATEVLLFAGLFCAYTVYRALHPEVFEHAAKFLDVKWGAINTVVLIASSFTVALAVRAAQLRQRNALIGLLAATILGGFGFLGIKYIEYSHKFHDDLLWGLKFDPRHEQPHAAPPVAAGAVTEGEPGRAVILDEPVAYEAAVLGEDLEQTSSMIKRPPVRVTQAASEAAASIPTTYDPLKVRNVHIFFGIYFCMTGLHGLHVIIGMIVLGWVLMRAIRGDFDDGYYLPVDLGGLYWHLVDLIWIYLFPLLYLIG